MLLVPKKSEIRERQISHDIAYMWDLKNDTNELIYKTETDSQTSRMNLWLPEGKGWGGGGIHWEFGINIHTPLYII